MCLVATAKFVVRGPMRALGGSGDFATIYAASRAWAGRSNPYDAQALNHFWQTGGASRIGVTTPSVYPPITFLLVYPVCVLPWKDAVVVWLILNLIAIVVILESLRRVIGASWKSPGMIATAALFISLEPTSTAIALGQTSLIASAAIAVSLLTGNANRAASGVFAAVATSVKPQLGIPAVLAAAVCRRWRAVLVAAVVLCGVLFASSLWAGHPAELISSWMHNLRAASAPGEVNDPTESNPISYQLINLHYALHTLIHSRHLVNGLVYAAAFLLISPGVALLLKGVEGPEAPRPDLLLITALLELIFLAAMYHRPYDAVVMVFPLIWAIKPQTGMRQSLPIFLLGAIFIFPGGVGFYALSQSRRMPAWLHSSVIWRCVVMPIQAWDVLLAACWVSALTACLLSCSITAPVSAPSQKTS